MEVCVEFQTDKKLRNMSALSLYLIMYLPHYRSALKHLPSLLILVLCYNTATQVSAQAPPSALVGEELRHWIKEQYYVNYRQYSYREARLILYNDIDNRDGMVEGVYGGFKKVVRDIEKPGDAMPINCEHTVPQSFFNKKAPMRSDMHHLFPTFAKWNGLRGSHPFAELEDSKTERWLISDQRRDSLPDQAIDSYSEYAQQQFEPRERHKGNLARSVFYFYTMYPEVGEISRVADPATLLLWHMIDPVDDEERARNDNIEAFQGNRNPYIDNPEWVLSAWPLKGTTTIVLNWDCSGIDQQRKLSQMKTDVKNMGSSVFPQWVRLTEVHKKSVAKKLCKWLGLKKFQLLPKKPASYPADIQIVNKELSRRPHFFLLQENINNGLFDLPWIDIGSKFGVLQEVKISVVDDVMNK